MPYDTAIEKSWQELEKLSGETNFSVYFMNDEYTVDTKAREILSLSCNVRTKDYLTILLLHYLARSIKGLAKISEEWISFKLLPGGDGYYPTFKKRVIDKILRKYGQHPEALLELIERFNAKRTQIADISVVIEAFKGVPVLLTAWKGDDEFSPEINVHFDKSICDIFCTEDIVVMSEAIAGRI
ncbi:MAG: hypothetical protein COV72_03870 [Candidatus Omnitrophica bacterium CG11_big_fil_rev_8_21_14_0_20_42_13]|uniref:DUF3786 domain-containing protein n=1 Tax=Candidatus Ghiorseimicrobium undicola TaxID=1974746 RepID=A0A2H0LXY6_9BACT|nr:MAG: hypothetical protein COV72_03870 [Candidatus Omnitrophica bacterium CG11_big_fil_rev_8_21_14_0_20_42_13]